MFKIKLPIRVDDIDLNGHVRGAVYVAYADHVRWQCLVEAGVNPLDLHTGGIGPINLRTEIDFRSELLMGSDVEVSCEFMWGEGKTFTVEQHMHGEDGALAATVRSVSGLLDLTSRRLVADPAKRFLELAVKPELMGLL
ncbi:acyl-CoA thioesterase [Kibdelosporangium philippinense]|uniref:Acyl-CoA thioesterase n=1 Tax=Kibdelosporangium philippinense TaxID=211113 RepID=A0ABS8ZS98_9PSEU|nr:acyl-CoA thioesterase [Kibdelosporangium philippinense]MCE7010464.1 acyl-CoA thioesterase [Kibdelosporangium philippinense]